MATLFPARAGVAALLDQDHRNGQWAYRKRAASWRRLARFGACPRQTPEERGGSPIGLAHLADRRTQRPPPGNSRVPPDEGAMRRYSRRGIPK